MKKNMVGWFEIPVSDMDRAKKFYETVFKIEIGVHDFGGTLMGWFPFKEDRPGAAGSLIQNQAYEPSDKKGVLIYFSSENVNNELAKVEKSGGKVLKPKTQISPDIGYMGLLIDTEGNRIALHSRA